MGDLGDGRLGLNFLGDERLTWSGSKEMGEIGKYTGAPILEQGDWM